MVRRATCSERKWAALKADLDALFEKRTRPTDGTVLIHGEYLEVVGTKAGLAA